MIKRIVILYDVVVLIVCVKSVLLWLCVVFRFGLKLILVCFFSMFVIVLSGVILCFDLLLKIYVFICLAGLLVMGLIIVRLEIWLLVSGSVFFLLCRSM